MSRSLPPESLATEPMLMGDHGPYGLRMREGALCWFGCGCGAGSLVRVMRSRWMRMVPLFALYECVRCGAKVFRTRLPYQPARAIYLQARPGVAAHFSRAVGKMLERFVGSDLH